MPDDIFKLGNFSSLPDASEEKSGTGEGQADFSSTPAVEKPEDPAQENPSTVSLEDDEVIKHPSVRSDPQAKFRYKDGRPLAEIELENVVPNKFQPRRIFNEQKLQELANSIKEHGIIQPLVVVQRQDGKYEIVVGERRFRAAKIAGLSKVPAFVHDVSEFSPETRLELALIENIQRADLNPIEEARAFQRLQQEFGLTVGRIAKKVGKDDSTVSNLLRLLNLPVEIQRALIEEVITEGQARPLLSLRDKEEMLQMFYIILKQEMKVREIEARVREIRRRRIKVQQMFTPDPFLVSLENLLRNKLGTRVEVTKGAKGGKITIDFFSDEELNDIVSKIA